MGTSHQPIDDIPKRHGGRYGGKGTYKGLGTGGGDKLRNNSELVALMPRLTELPARWQAVIQMKVDGASVPEISEKLGVGQQAIYKIFQQAKRRLAS